MNILLLGSAGDGSHAPGSIAVSADARRWVLLDACVQAGHDERLRRAAAAGEIAAVVLLDRRFEHHAGLPALCEAAVLDVFTTPALFEQLTAGLTALGLPEGRCSARWHLLPVAGDVHEARFQVPGVEALQWEVLADDGEPEVGERLVVHALDLRDGSTLVYRPGQAPQQHAARAKGLEVAP